MGTPEGDGTSRAIHCVHKREAWQQKTARTFRESSPHRKRTHHDTLAGSTAGSTLLENLVQSKEGVNFVSIRAPRAGGDCDYPKSLSTLKQRRSFREPKDIHPARAEIRIHKYFKDLSIKQFALSRTIPSNCVRYRFAEAWQHLYRINGPSISKPPLFPK